MNAADVLFATALTNIVFPVPTLSLVSSHLTLKEGRCRTWRTIEKYTTRRLDTNLLVEVKLREGQFDSLSNLLFLDVHPSNIGIRPVLPSSAPPLHSYKGKNSHVGFLIRSQHANTTIRLRRQDVYETVRMTMQRD